MKPDGTLTSIPTDDTFRGAGFTDHNPARWYFCRRIDDMVTLNITVDKATGDYEELVCDEYFGQPFYYLTSTTSELAEAVDGILAELSAAGVEGLVVDHEQYRFGS